MLWIDPVQIAPGILIAADSAVGRSLRATGVLLFSYARLKLQLRSRASTRASYAYDWRLGIGWLGAALRRESRGRHAGRLVAHSMGGLVARVAATHACPSGLVRG